MKRIISNILLALFLVPTAFASMDLEEAKMYVEENFSYQLTYPQKKNRMSMAQFGYGLSYFQLKVYPISQFIKPHKFGKHSYSKPSLKEKNGVIYTCRGGFIDFSHLRAGVDWAVHMTFQLLSRPDLIELKNEAGELKINFKNLDELDLEELADLGQKIAFERLLWHELASWHYHAPNHMFSEQQSAFSPEDNYSNFLGTKIGKLVALRILNLKEKKSYSKIASEEIRKYLKSLVPMKTKRKSRQAYDQVDRFKQIRRSPEKRNEDVWWDSNILFTDHRYLFKRYTKIGPKLDPWLVPDSEALGCPELDMDVLEVPTVSKTNKNLYDYYSFKITPDEEHLFFNKKTHKQEHEIFGIFTTENFQDVLSFVEGEMEKELLPGFTIRDLKNPVSQFKNLKRVWTFKNRRYQRKKW